MDDNKKYINFEDWFNECENFSLRSDRFFESINQFTSEQGKNANLVLWLRTAWEQGQRSMQQENM